MEMLPRCSRRKAFAPVSPTTRRWPPRCSNGTQMGPLRAIVAMKSVGLHVAADALALGNLAGAHAEGGAIVVIGDDPWSDSTQVPADSRYLCKHLFMPVLEPSSLQELKDWIDLGYKLSREANLYIGYLVTTNQVDGGGTVTVRPNHFPKLTRETATYSTRRPLTWRTPCCFRRARGVGKRISRPL